MSSAAGFLPAGGEIEAARDVRIDAEDEDVAVLALHLGAAQDAQAVLVLERAVVRLEVELAMLGEDEAVERALGPLALQDLQVGLDRGAAVVGELGVDMQIENH